MTPQVSLVILKTLIINTTTASQTYWLRLKLFEHNYHFHINFYFNYNKLEISRNRSGLVRLANLLLNLRSPRDYVIRSSVHHAVRPSFACGTSLVHWMALQCANALPAGEAHCLYVRCRHRSSKSTAVSNKTFLFQVTHIYLFCGSVTLST